MPRLLSKLAVIQAALDKLAAHHSVPGASLAVMDGDQGMEAVTGVANVVTGVDVTPDTLFQIGSNTKIYTAALVMQLVERGEVELDQPVRRYIEDFRVADEEASRSITVRHLLTHSSGIQGDYFDDFGRGDDCTALYVRSLRHIGQLHAPGERFSYCNSGFVAAGHLLERVAGMPYHQVLRERLLTPLRLAHTTVLLEEMVGFRYAAGHTGGERGTPTVVPSLMMARAAVPAGSRTSATARDVLGFVRMHLDGGQAPDGQAVLAPESVAAMQRPQYPLPGSVTGRARVGLSWMMDEWGGHRVIGHTGGTIGQLSFLQVMPEDRVAVCLLTNSTTGGRLWRDVGRLVFEEVVGVAMPQVPRPPVGGIDLDLVPYAGVFERLGLHMELSVEGHHLIAIATESAAADGQDPAPNRYRLDPIDRERFYLRDGDGDDGLATFSDFDQRGRPGAIALGGRVAPRL